MPALAMKLKAPERVTRTRVDTIEVTPAKVQSWPLAPFQRPLKVNQKVRDLADQIKRDEVIPGIITLAHLGRSTGTPFLLDGQHRREAFLISGCELAYVDVREAWFDTLAEMGEEFVHLNSALVKITPDDVLRGLEQSSLALTKIRQSCPFVGYDYIRRGPSNAIVSMSAAIRCWESSKRDCPGGSAGGAAALAQAMTLESAEQLSGFLHCCMKAWGREQEYWRLWGNLNLTLCAWLYHRLVIAPSTSKRTPTLTKDLFTKAMMSLSADSHYCDWLVGRNVGEKDRSPCYQRIKANFTKRLSLEMGRKVALPQPAWASH